MTRLTGSVLSAGLEPDGGIEAEEHSHSAARSYDNITAVQSEIAGSTVSASQTSPVLAPDITSQIQTGGSVLFAPLTDQSRESANSLIPKCMSDLKSQKVQEMAVMQKIISTLIFRCSLARVAFWHRNTQ